MIRQGFKVIRSTASIHHVQFWSHHGYNPILNFFLGDYIFPEIYQAWKRERKIKGDSRDLYFSVDGQCDSLMQLIVPLLPWIRKQTKV